MRVRLAALLALLVLSAPVHAEPVPHVAAQAANVRATPSADADRVGRLAPGDAVTVIGRSDDGEWLRVTGVGPDGTGYVLARLLRPADQAGAAAAPARPSLFAQAVRGDGGAAGGGAAPPGGSSLFAQAARGGEIEREQAERRRLAAERAAALARQRAEQDERARRAEAQRRADEQAERERAEEERRQREWEEEMEWAEAEAEAEASRLQVLNTIQSIERGFQQQIQQRQAQINQMQQRQAEERRRAEIDRRRAEAERQRREAEARSARERQLAQQRAQQQTRQDNQARQQAAQRQQEAQRQAALRAQTEARQQAEQRAREEQARQRAEQLRQQLARQTLQNQQLSTLTPYGQRPAGGSVAGGAPSPAVRTASPPAPPATVTLRETMSYCWNTSGRDNGWFCDGPGQLLLTSWTLREALDYAGCDNSMGQSHQASDSRRVPFRDGFIYYCEHARTPTVHWRDVATLHQVPGTLLERRRSYECRESGPLVCTAEAAIRVFGGR